ncbi:hypothetical protein M9H77_03960 [Catharanthus roseus]|uniref:Uncharacterized protein n=1 Tax=Catharanthus roseus TaxID=4058 RepID=A0ACC0CCQ9_CATRO|nr:hypothetical protein M9H77_03960 [Catharanthus roseus]
MAGMEMDDLAENFGRCLKSLVDEGSIVSRRYYLSRRTVLEMLRDRGYLVPDAELELTLQEFRDKYTQDPDVSRLRISALHKDDPSNKILVLYCGPSVVKVNTIRLMGQQIMNGESLAGLILIIQNQITSQAMKTVELFSFKVEIFQITDLLVNITKHVLKPRHQLLTEEEKKRLLEKYSIGEKQLPWMLQKDAIARYYGLEKGQVLKVTYNSDVFEQHVTYRCIM